MLDLDEATVGRLFMIPDGSIVWALKVGENADTPAGLDVQSTNPFLAEDETNSVIAFRDEIGPAMWLDALYIRRLNGTGRRMQFDLTAGSRSWIILLNYLYEALQEQKP